MDEPTSDESARRLVATLLDQGVMLWSDGVALSYAAPAGVVGHRVLADLRRLKAEILHLLGHGTGESVRPSGNAGQGLSQSNSSVAGRNRAVLAPLTYVQSEYLHVAKLCPHEVRRTPIAFRIKGRVSIESLIMALKEIVLRHESLRTTFITFEATSAQWISSSRSDQVSLVRVQADAGEGAEQKVDRLLQEFIDQPIPLDVGPLFEARIFLLDDEHHLLAIAISHIVFDDVSFAILFQELFALYSSFLRGSENTLTYSRLQMAEVAHEQRMMFEPWMSQHASYWRKYLGGVPPLPIPGNGEGCRATANTGINDCQVNIGEQLTFDLRRLSKELQTTVSTMLLAIYAVLLSKFYGQKDLVVMLTVRGRYRPEHERIIGYLAHPLHVRLVVKPEETFADLLAHVSHEVQAAYDHNDFGLIRTLMPQLPRAASFSWMPADNTTVERDSAGNVELWGGCVVTQIPCAHRRASLDTVHELTQKYPEIFVDWRPVLTLRDGPGSIVGYINYNPALFARARISSLALEFQTLANQLCADPGRCLASVN